jgi:L-seryl-tRNA(Ser) seleniumtransferase
MAQPVKSTNPQLRLVPSVDQLLRTDIAVKLGTNVGMKRLTALARTVTAEIRETIRNGSAQGNGKSAAALLTDAALRLQEAVASENLTSITQVINATGVVLHTNLGRAPLSKAAQEAITNHAARYCSLEYDKASGLRGKRGARVEAILKYLTGAEDALVVNNCAAAALLILQVIAGDGETIVSRGELVEIGGDFRVPDVMASSGTKMVEVGTTNKTHLDDFRKAITSKTRLIMRVHPSNYRVVGFTSSPTLSELTTIGREAMVPLYEDAGSGQLKDLSHLGIEGEPVISKLIEGGADLVSFSGDKLLGSIQSGLIVGRRGLVDRLRRHPLYRALRADKIRLAALEATLTAHQKDQAESEVPVLQMLALTKELIAERAHAILDQLSQASKSVIFELTDGESAIGGGAGPNANLPTRLIAISDLTRSAQEVETFLRTSEIPVIARISDQKVLIDLRTVFPEQEAAIVTLLNRL